jgi:hypothetical protein
MGRPQKHDESVKNRARQLRAKGGSRESVRKALAAEGFEVSAGWLSGVYAEAGGASGAPVEAAPPAPMAALAAVVAVSEDPSATLEEVRAALGVLVPMLRAMLESEGGGEDCEGCGRGPSNIDGVTKIGRVLGMTGVLVKKLQPPVPADPNVNPDMVAAAGFTVERMRKMVADERAGRPA